MCEFSELIGKTLVSIDGAEYGSERITFFTDEKEYYLYTAGDEYSNVDVNDICGDINDILNSPIIVAEEVTTLDDPEGYVEEGDRLSYTWTFYKIDTIKGGVTIRWYGESNGYYSESVYFGKYDYPVEGS